MSLVLKTLICILCTYFRFDRSFISCLNIWSFKSSHCSRAKIFGHKWHLKWSECILIMWSCRIFSVVKLVEQWEQANGLSVPGTKKKIIYYTYFNLVPTTLGTIQVLRQQRSGWPWVVCDRNQGLILVSVSEPIFFFRNRNFFFSIFSFKLQFFLFFFPPLGEVQVFISFRINPDLQKQFKRI